MSKDIHEEFMQRLPGMKVPQVCFNGAHLGGHDEVFKMNELGDLQKMVAKMQKLADGEASECGDCGGTGFVVCQWCGGDRRSMAVSIGEVGGEDRENTGTVARLKCTACNENGLAQCQTCMMTGHETEADC